MRQRTLNAHEHYVVRKELQRMHEQGWGIALGSVLGAGLFIATNVLVLRGGDPVGPHLALLSVYFPGYSVTVLGSFVGFVYAFVLGYAVGRTVVTIYNYLAGVRLPQRRDR